MTSETEQPTGQISAMIDGATGPTMAMADGKGPWGTNDDAPQPGGKPGGGREPTSPWLPPRDDGARGQPPRQPRSLEELLRRGTGGGGSGGPFGPGMPTLPGGRSMWSAVAIGLVLLWLLFTSVWRVNPEEEGVVTRFGSYSRTVGPGVSLTWPSPFETMQKVSVREIRTENIPEAGSGENLVLTGDANIIDLAYSVRWSIKQPERFLFQMDDPRAAIRASAESAMRATLANFTLVQAIGTGRTDMERQVQLRMQQMLDSYRAGVRIEGVAVREADPPQQVEEAFNNVNAARQRAETRMNEARAHAQQVLRRAEGEAGAFDRYYAEYRLAPEVTRRRLYYETMEQVLRPADKTVVASGGVTPYLPLPEVRRRPPAEAAPAASPTPANRAPAATPTGAAR